jgi:hypothetical protein
MLSVGAPQVSLSELVTSHLGAVPDGVRERLGAAHLRLKTGVPFPRLRADHTPGSTKFQGSAGLVTGGTK